MSTARSLSLLVLLTLSTAAQAADVALVDQLREYTRRDLMQLREDAPNYGSVVGLGVTGTMVTATAGVLIGLGVDLAGRSASWFSWVSQIGGTMLAVIGGIVGIVGVVLMIAAIVTFVSTHEAVAQHDARIDELQRRLEGLDRKPVPRPAMPQVQRPTVPSFVLARF